MKTKLRIIYAITFLAVLLIEICISLFIHDDFIRPYVGDVLVMVLICALLRIFIPEEVKLLPAYVFIFAAAVEIAQYFDIVKLLGFEDNAFLSTIIGRTFSLHDILCYGAGCILFFVAKLLIKRLCRKESN
ncbi:MAG: DUF2809 domain-containing protein [Ruminiclostridium sp.]|nr:DUF2809 domain-containing protein [Ruminiclostridium sp.]